MGANGDNDETEGPADVNDECMAMLLVVMMIVIVAMIAMVVVPMMLMLIAQANSRC